MKERNGGRELTEQTRASNCRNYGLPPYRGRSGLNGRVFEKQIFLLKDSSERVQESTWLWKQVIEQIEFYAVYLIR